VLAQVSPGRRGYGRVGTELESEAMRNLWMIAAAFALLALATPARAGEPIDLKVLYAGNPGSDREKDFKTFLEDHFAKVGTTDYEKFTEGEAKSYDVVIFDWTSIYPRDEHGKIPQQLSELKSPTPPQLAPEFGRPAILIGAAGGSMAGPLKLKIDWL
jgi:hypothetical protein